MLRRTHGHEVKRFGKIFTVYKTFLSVTRRTRIVPRGTYNDGGRPTVAASKVEATNNQCLLFSRKMGVVVSVTGKGEN
jgi:hypothetical protein